MAILVPVLILAVFAPLGLLTLAGVGLASPTAFGQALVLAAVDNVGEEENEEIRQSFKEFIVR